MLDVVINAAVINGLINSLEWGKTYSIWECIVMVTKLPSREIWPGQLQGLCCFKWNIQPERLHQPCLHPPSSPAMLNSSHKYLLSEYLNSIHLKMYQTISLPRTLISWFGPALRVEDICMVTILRLDCPNNIEGQPQSSFLLC